MSAINIIMFAAIFCVIIALAVYYYERKKSHDLKEEREREQEIAECYSDGYDYDGNEDHHNMTFSREQFSPDSFNEAGGWRPRQREAWEGNGPTFTTTFSGEQQMMR